MQRAGYMRDRAAFHRRAAGDDEYGNERLAFADAPFLTCWADILERMGREAVASGVVEASRMATLRVRFAPETSAILASDMVKVRGADWNIRSIAEVGRSGEMLEFLIETGVAI